MNRDSAVLKVFLMGPPGAEIDGAPIEVDTRKALALLAYLTVEGRPIARDSLAGLLWPDYQTEAARGALRRTLSSLRKALGGRWLTADRMQVAMDLDGVWSDISEFRALTSREDTTELRAATELYRGDFMEGFTLRDGLAFEDWQLYRADELRRLFGVALEKLVSALEKEGDLTGALEYARRWLAMDELDETAHRRLMHLYARGGKRADALRQYRECVSILDRELGVAPLSETTELYEALIRDEITPTQPAIRSLGRAAPSHVPMVGRTDEWRRLMEALEEHGSDGLLVVIEGEAGIGKTRLGEALAEHAAGAGATVVRARCYEGESNLAYGVVIDALRSALSSADGWLERLSVQSRHEVARLLPEVQSEDTAEQLTGGGAQRRFLDGVADALLQACSPGLLFFDDLHWADEASLEVLAYTTRRLKGRSATVVASWRSEQVGSGHRLRQIVHRTRAGGTTITIPLHRLSRQQVVELVEESGFDAPREIAERLHRETEGLPLFVVEYMAALRAHASELDWTLPVGVRDLLEARVAGVGDLAGQIMTTAAAMGRSFDFDAVRDASGRSEDEMVSSLDELLSVGLIDEVPEGSDGGPAYDFNHDLVRAFVYENTGLARRRLLHRRIAEVLLRRSRSVADAGNSAAAVARHLQLGGSEAEAAAYFQVAGKQARAVYANSEALAYYRDALALGGENVAELHESIGDLHTLLGEYADAIRAYEAAAAEMRDTDHLAEIEHKLGGVCQRRGAWDAAETHYAAALDLLGSSGATALGARIQADRSLAAHSARHSGAAAEFAAEALEIAKQVGDTVALGRVHNILGIIGASEGRNDDARRHLEQSLELAEAVGDPSARVASLNNLALVTRSLGDLDDATRFAEEGLDLCRKMGDRHREAALHNNLADLLHDRGETEAAMEHLKAGAKLFSEVGDRTEYEPGIWRLVEW